MRIVCAKSSLVILEVRVVKFCFVFSRFGDAGKMLSVLRRRRREKRKSEAKLLRKVKNIRKHSMRKEISILRPTRPLTARKKR